MKKDIVFPEVEDIAIAIVKEENELAQIEWNAYMINLKQKPIEGVLVTSKGYGEINGKKVLTSTLRHFLDVIEAKSYSKIEPVIEDVFGLNNEYWISFYLNKTIYDKKYIFLPESITEENLINIPLINKPGVMIK
jgi:CRISPR/Cas system-associated exonuclease Cas4 (RecB family)